MRVARTSSLIRLALAPPASRAPPRLARAPRPASSASAYPCVVVPSPDRPVVSRQSRVLGRVRSPPRSRVFIAIAIVFIAIAIVVVVVVAIDR